MRNCPNCGAPIEPYKCKCEYCDTWYFDFNAFNMEDGKPCYVKFNTRYGALTMLAKPELQTIEVSQDSCSAVDRMGNTVATFVTNKSCDLSVIFHALVDYEHNSLYTLETNGCR